MRKVLFRFERETSNRTLVRIDRKVPAGPMRRGNASGGGDTSDAW
jgi:hypothetical protein